MLPRNNVDRVTRRSCRGNHLNRARSIEPGNGAVAIDLDRFSPRQFSGKYLQLITRVTVFRRLSFNRLDYSTKSFEAKLSFEFLSNFFRVRSSSFSYTCKDKGKPIRYGETLVETLVETRFVRERLYRLERITLKLMAPLQFTSNALNT